MELQWKVIIWTVFVSVILLMLLHVVYLLNRWKSERWELFDFLQKETTDSLQHKIFSFDEAYNPHFIMNAQGKVLDMNVSAGNLFGYGEKELVGKNFETIIPEKHREKFRDMLLRGGSSKNEAPATMSAVKKNGYDFTVGVLFRRKEIKKSHFYLVIIIDRTKELDTIRKYEGLNEILKIKNDILTKGEEIGKHGSWLWDVTKDRLLTSRGYRTIMGLPINEIEFDRQFLRDKVYKKDEGIVKEALDKAFKGERYDIVYRVTRSKDFKLVKIQSTAWPIMNENGVLVYIRGAMRMLEEVDIMEVANKNI